jgi:glycosyltransferase involved in cell wall biosynthesis
MPTVPPRVSVVTPVHNGEEYLRECIESVRAQTYTNWDYTIVDNCSTDRTGEIAAGYAAQDSRIRVVRNAKLVRVMENHNIAVRQTSPDSRYCKVVAADDWLFPECVERMVAVAEAHPSVAIVGAYGLRNGTQVIWDGLPYPSTRIPGREVCRLYFLRDLYVFGAPTSLLFRADVVRSRAAFFNESNVHSDKEVCFEILQQHDFGFVHQVLTFMRVQERSLSADAVRLKRNLVSALHDLVRYGPAFLSPDEMERCVREQLRLYYRSLGREAVRRPGREFWAYHRGKMAELGHPMNSWRVAGAAFAFAFQYLGNLNNLSTVSSRLARRRGQGG